jgi:hypothetical protein
MTFPQLSHFQIGCGLQQISGVEHFPRLEWLETCSLPAAIPSNIFAVVSVSKTNSRNT